MIVLISILIFLGFYAFYSTSKRAKLNNTKVDIWLQNSPKVANAIGWGCIIGGFYVLIHHLGIGAGIFTAIIILMTVGSLIIVVSPLISKKK